MRNKKGSVVVTADRGMLRLILPRHLFSGDSKRIYLGLSGRYFSFIVRSRSIKKRDYFIDLQEECIKSPFLLLAIVSSKIAILQFRGTGDIVTTTMLWCRISTVHKPFMSCGILLLGSCTSLYYKIIFQYPLHSI